MQNCLYSYHPDAISHHLVEAVKAKEIVNWYRLRSRGMNPVRWWKKSWKVSSSKRCTTKRRRDFSSFFKLLFGVTVKGIGEWRLHCSTLPAGKRAHRMFLNKDVNACCQDECGRVLPFVCGYVPHVLSKLDFHTERKARLFSSKSFCFTSSVTNTASSSLPILSLPPSSIGVCVCVWGEKQGSVVE